MKKNIGVRSCFIQSAGFLVDLLLLDSVVTRKKKGYEQREKKAN